MWPGWTTGPPRTRLSILFRSRTCQSGCKAILKKDRCNIVGLGRKCSAFPLLICIMVMTRYTTFKSVGQMVVWITEYPRKHLDGVGPGAPTWIMKHFVKCLTTSRAAVQLGWHSPFEHRATGKCPLILYPKYLNSGMSGLAAVTFYGPSAGVPQTPVRHSLRERGCNGKAGWRHTLPL